VCFLAFFCRQISNTTKSLTVVITFFSIFFSYRLPICHHLVANAAAFVISTFSFPAAVIITIANAIPTLPSPPPRPRLHPPALATTATIFILSLSPTPPPRHRHYRRLHQENVI